jgi:cell division protein FtsB
MLFKKIKYKLTVFQKLILRKTKHFEINWMYWVLSSICLLSIFLLSLHVFRIIRKGYERYEIIQREKERLEELEARNIELKEELKYYSSTEFIDIKAREELNLAFPNQRLVYIDRSEKVEIEEVSRRKEEIKPHWKNWFDLIF